MELTILYGLSSKLSQNIPNHINLFSFTESTVEILINLLKYTILKTRLIPKTL
jgi:hypothetical protein